MDKKTLKNIFTGSTASGMQGHNLKIFLQNKYLLDILLHQYSHAELVSTSHY
jgi:hypothetical protein